LGQSVGRQGLTQEGGHARIAPSLLGMLVYVWVHQLPYGIGAVVALFQDVITMTVYVHEREINLPIISGVLTIVGFSINDTIVIFDRVRENQKLMRGKPLEEVMNTSLNQCLSRTIITSGTVLLTVGALFFFGGEVINDFAFVLWSACSSASTDRLRCPAGGAVDQPCSWRGGEWRRPQRCSAAILPALCHPACISRVCEGAAGCPWRRDIRCIVAGGMGGSRTRPRSRRFVAAPRPRARKAKRLFAMRGRVLAGYASGSGRTSRSDAPDKAGGQGPYPNNPQILLRPRP
jgi:hypothetical protein